jgi:hypothetical protein
MDKMLGGSSGIDDLLMPLGTTTGLHWRVAKAGAKLHELLKRERF